MLAMLIFIEDQSDATPSLSNKVGSANVTYKTLYTGLVTINTIAVLLAQTKGETGCGLCLPKELERRMR